jgi:hypothetical protein
VRAVPKERTLTLRELNRALLARQLLLHRARLSPGRAVERIGALQAQWPPSPYLALWSRLEGFRRDQLMRAVERRQLVKATLMRSTLHLVSARDYLVFCGLVRAARRRYVGRIAERDGLAGEVERLLPRLRDAVDAVPRSRPELLELLGVPKLRIEDRRPWHLWHALAAEAELVHTPEASVWRRHTAGARFVTAASWLGAPGATGPDAADALLARYLAAFGPATRADAARWTGLAAAALAPAFDHLRLRRFRDAEGRELFDVPRAPLPSGSAEAPVRLLPMWDSALLAHDDRSRILPADFREAVIRRNGDIRPTFLVDGFVAGTWNLDGERVEVEPLGLLPARARAAVKREARALESWLGA